MTHKMKMQEQLEEVLLIMAEKGLIPYKDGNQWCILLGPNLQEGICGFGYTIIDAMMDFYQEAKAEGIIRNEEQKSAEDKTIEDVISYLYDGMCFNSQIEELKYRSNLANRLKSLRPRPKDKIYKEKGEAFKLGKHQLAITFINYLDENRPEGKMCLSNGECEDIDKAFMENDWAKIMRYTEKYRPSWKPSEQEKGALRTAIHVLTEERNFPKAAGHLQAILDIFEGKESRKDFKPDEEQMEALSWLIDYVAPSEKYIVIIKNLYEQLKKLM